MVPKLSPATRTISSNSDDDELSPFVRGVHLVELPQVTDSRGHLTFVEGAYHVGFDIARVYYIYDVPRGGRRGGHAHRDIDRVLIAVSGRVDTLVDDGTSQRLVRLDRPEVGLHLEPMVWSDLTFAEPGTVCVVLASGKYREDEYVRDYGEFLHLTRTPG